MKIPSSSSLILATLAISSSSSSLAVPTDTPEGGMTSSPSNHHIASRHDPTLRSVDNEEVADDYHERSMVDDLESRGVDPLTLVANIIAPLPIIGSLLSDPLRKVGHGLFPSADSASAESVDEANISAQDVTNLEKAVADASSALQECIPLPLPSPPVPIPAIAVPSVVPRDDVVADPASSSSSSPSLSSDPTPTNTSDSLSSSATETPAGPPNTPVVVSDGRRQLPVQPPILPPVPMQPPVTPPVTPAKPPSPGAQAPPSAAELPVDHPMPIPLPVSALLPLPVQPPVAPPSGAPNSPAQPA